ncbi:MAG: Benzil reductase ((S)-benzoin forming) [Syntrophorhabdus sp. PtaU1.Bin002]|nr:MAG: Benzil reductase ((S)-benzoin forming) [Syntrophorhabdus sp. PtaU1.Bin002]
MKYYIITGSSKGLGESLTTKLMGSGSHIFCISRKKNKKLQEAARKASASMDYFEFDLSNPEGLPALMEEIFNRIEKDRAQEICLINNAGMLPPIKAIHETRVEDIRSNITINLIAPVAIIAQFLKLTQSMKISKKVVNISSKASRSPRAQWACYSSSKSGIDTITRTVSIEQNGTEHPARIISFYPGPMETAMRKENQKTKPLFRRAMEFIKNIVSTKKPVARHPDFVAERLVTHISSPEFGKRLFVSLEDVA